MTDSKEIYRHEWKYLISRPEAELLKRRLGSVLQRDPHTDANGSYQIRSLYFDDRNNSAYQEKMMGVYARKKWRIRIYNFSDRKISLERKKKRGNYIFKESADLSREDVEMILEGKYDFLLHKPPNLCREFYTECVTEQLRPKVIVDYDRIPLIQEAGTVRITLDMDVRAAVGRFQIFDAELPTILAMDPEYVILEVKYTEFLPEIIRQLLPPESSEFTALSKYTACFDAAWHLSDPTAGISKTMRGWRKN